MTCHQVVEIAPQGRNPVLRGNGGRFCIRHAAIGQRSQEKFYSIGKLDDAIKADNSQRTVRLVHAGTGFFQTFARRVAGVAGKTLRGTFKSEVDLTLDPRQRPDVEIDAHERLFSKRRFICLLFTP